ncbi:MAG: PstS family phosphate ABC transporter substrate-binding protein [Chloroflexi bacterium]|nr:PstS family phosphate ABC transporter substrate-binding protein [Chloroflexota bacterium]
MREAYQSQRPVRAVRYALGTLSSQGTRFRIPDRWIYTLVTLAFLAATLLGGCAQNSSEAPRTGVSRVIINKGSDTLVNLALAWAEAYMAAHPEVSISVTGGGTGTGITAMINGTIDIANASRSIKSEELELATSKGMQPTEFTVALDAIAVVVNPSNPLDHITLQQLSDIYTGKITNWSELGGEDRPIVLLSRESNSGTYTYFLEHVVRLGDASSTLLFSPDTLLMPSSEGISVEVRQNPNAIGYDGLGYVTNDQKVLAVARDASGPYVLPSVDTVNDDSYPIARALYIYTPNEPAGQIKEYIDWILSDGQNLISKLGFVPLTK